jgi:hypothetical protein
MASSVPSGDPPTIVDAPEADDSEAQAISAVLPSTTEDPNAPGGNAPVEVDVRFLKTTLSL